MTSKALEGITYETIDQDEFAAELERRGYSPWEISETLEHEDAHFRKALELGYHEINLEAKNDKKRG